MLSQNFVFICSLLLDFELLSLHCRRFYDLVVLDYNHLIAIEADLDLIIIWDQLLFRWLPD